MVDVPAAEGRSKVGRKSWSRVERILMSAETANGREREEIVKSRI